MAFLCEATQNDHIRLLYKFESDKKNLIELGVVDMRQLLLNENHFSLFSLHGDCQTIYNIHPLPKYEAMKIEQQLETVEKTRNMHEHLQGDKKLFRFFFF